jgi:ribose/xylose/arabinose/galactoside ABC-type transport system permease subunit
MTAMRASLRESWPGLAAASLSPDRLQSNAVRIATILLIVWSLLTTNGFLTSSNISAIMYSTAAVGIAAVGMSLVTISGNLFMLSMGATAAVSTVLFVSWLHFGMSVSAALVVFAGAVTGLVQGLAVATLGANPIILSIAFASIVMGFGEFYSGGVTVVGEGDVSWLAVGTIAWNIPNQVAVFLVVVAAATLFLERMRLGRELRLIGMNLKAARYAGLRVVPAVSIAYVAAGASASAAGVFFGSQATQGNLQLGQGLDFDAIAAVLVGGVSIKGGHGSALDAAVGAVFLAILSNVLLLHGLSLQTQLMVKGLVVILSVLMGALASRSRR